MRHVRTRAAVPCVFRTEPAPGAVAAASRRGAWRMHVRRCCACMRHAERLRALTFASAASAARVRLEKLALTYTLLVG
jgi:hypothetical protein